MKRNRHSMKMTANLPHVWVVSPMLSEVLNCGYIHDDGLFSASTTVINCVMPAKIRSACNFFRSAYAARQDRDSLWYSRCLFQQWFLFCKYYKIYQNLELFNDSVCILRIIFGSESFNTGRIKDGHIGFSRFNSLADRFSNINKVIENELQII